MPNRRQPGPLGADTFQIGGIDNDPLGNPSHEAAEWGLPSIPAGVLDVPAHLPGDYGPDYAMGFVKGLVTPYNGEDTTLATDVAQSHRGGLLARTDYERKTFEVPHEATHRRYEPPRMVAINQTAAGFSVLLPTNPGLHFIKLIACSITLDAAGTIQFVQGDNAGLSTAAISGTMNIATNGGFVLPPAELANPWLFTSSDLALGIFTVTGKAQGFAVCAYAPYDQ